MVKGSRDVLTRANILQIGLAILVIGPICYGFFRLVGFEVFPAGIAAQSILILIIFGWTGSYLFRVVTGKMTFNEQRKRYREAYERITTAELQSRFESMTEEEQIRLIKELESGDESSNPDIDLKDFS